MEIMEMRLDCVDLLAENSAVGDDDTHWPIPGSMVSIFTVLTSEQ